MPFSGEYDNRQYLLEFIYAPGFFKPGGEEIVPNTPSVEICAKTCYLNPSCVAFQYSATACRIYRSLTQGQMRLYVYSFIRRDSVLVKGNGLHYSLVHKENQTCFSSASFKYCTDSLQGQATLAH